MAKHQKHNPWPARVAAMGAVALAGPFLAAGLAHADNVVNYVAANGNGIGGMLKIADTTVTPSIKYQVNPTGQACDAADGSPVTITVNTPSGVTADPATFELAGCGDGVFQLVTFTASSLGTFDIPNVSVSDDSAPDTYNTSPTAFHLVVGDSSAGGGTAGACDGVLAPAAPTLGLTGGVAGLASWYTSAPTVTVTGESTPLYSTVVNGGSPSAWSAALPTITDQGTTVVSAKNTDPDCSLESSVVSETVNLDSIAPVIVDEGFLSGTAGTNGWYTSAVTNRFTVTDASPGSGLAAGTTPKDVATTGEGSALTVSSGPVSDIAGNTASALTSAAYKVDLNNPTAALDAFNTSAQYFGGAGPTCTGQDTATGSGIASCVVTGYDGTLGTHTGVVLTSTATDNSGRTGTATDTKTYTVTYGVDGSCFIRQPIACDNSSVFSRGKAIPVKFGLLNDGGTAYPNGFPTTGWKIQAQSVPSCNVAATTVSGSTDGVTLASTGAFRYDVGADQYVYNADMSKQPIGSCWRFVVTLPDNVPHASAVFRLQK